MTLMMMLLSMHMSVITKMMPQPKFPAQKLRLHPGRLKDSRALPGGNAREVPGPTRLQE